MEVTLYKYTGERSRVDKSDFLIKVLSVTGTFKSDTSVLSPSLILSLPVEERAFLSDEEGNRLADVILNSDDGGPLDFNYFYISEFRRFYYLTSLVISSGSLLMVSGEVDPLYSFKDAILANRAFIERNEDSFSEFLEDALMPLDPTKEIIEYIPANGALKNIDFKRTGLNWNFVIPAISTSNALVNHRTKDAVTPSLETRGFSASTFFYCLNYENFQRFTNAIMGDYSKYASYFKGAFAMPYDVYGNEHITDLEENEMVLYFERENVGVINVRVPSVMTHTAPAVSDPKIVADFYVPTANNFLEMGSHCHYEIYLPFVGFHEFEYSQIAGKRIVVFYVVNYEDGSGECYVKNQSDNRLLYSTPCTLGVRLAFTSSNQAELNAQQNSIVLNSILGLLASGVTFAAGVASGNGLMATSGALGIGSSLARGAVQSSALFLKASATHNGALGALFAPLEVFIRITRDKPLDGLDLARFAHDYGRPLQQSRKLGDLSGFTKCGRIHLENITATDAEKSAIESSLLSGVIL